MSSKIGWDKRFVNCGEPYLRTGVDRWSADAAPSPRSGTSCPAVNQHNGKLAHSVRADRREVVSAPGLSS